MGEMNEKRAEFGLVGLQAFADRMYGGEGDRNMSDLEAFDQALSDMLGDLMHHVHQNLPDMSKGDAVLLIHQAVERGAGHFTEEVQLDE